ncbi:MAG: TIGR00159 family protein, partial [Acidobacteria bacterium]|nr:TIGR00159 family protein [Acidobacteriota bacterium]
MAFLLPAWFDRLPELTTAAVLDILILAVVIYQIVLMVKGTRATQILVGIALLAAAYYVARWGRLHTVEWLLGHLFPYLIFALIVLFQNEIRRGLARMGRNP